MSFLVNDTAMKRINWCEMTLLYISTWLKMENKQFYVEYLQNQQVKIETQFIGENQRRRPLKDIGDLVAAVKQAPF